MGYNIPVYTMLDRVSLNVFISLQFPQQ